MATIVGSATLGNWNATGSWVGGVVPTAADDVTLTAASIGTLVINGTSGTPSLCRSLNCTGFVGTITQASAAQINIGDGTTGNLVLVAGMTYAPNAAAVIKFVSTTTGNQITTAGKTMCLTTFDGVGGAWTLQDNWTGVASTTAGITLTNGSLDTNGKTITGIGLSSNNSNTRSLTLGATTWGFGTSTTPSTLWDIGTSTGMTLSAASSTINMTQTTTSKTFAGGGLTYGTLSGTALTTGATTLTGANTFSTLTLSGGANVAPSYLLAANQTVSGTFTSNGNSVSNRILIASSTYGTSRTITVNTTISCTNIDLRDITGAGTASWNLSAITGGSGDCGGNSGITFNTPKNCFMKTAVSVNWSGTNWFTTSGGSTAITPAVPLVQDTAVFDANSVTTTAKTITADMPRICGFNWTGVLNTPAFNRTVANLEIYGSCILVSGMTHTGAQAVLFNGRGNYSLDGGTLTWTASSTITIQNMSGNTLSLLRNFASSSPLVLNSNSGTLSGAFTTGFTTLTVGGGTFTLGGTCTLTGAISVTGGTLDTNGFGITGHTTYTQSGGLLNLSGQLNGSGAITISNASGTAVANTGASGELKGTTFTLNAAVSCIVNAAKITCSSTFTHAGTGTPTVNIGSGGMTCTTANIGNTAGGNVTFSSGTGQIVCSSTATLGNNNTSSITIGSGGFKATTITLSSGASVPTFNLGSGIIECTGTGTVWTGAGTLNANTSQILISDTSATTKTFAGGSKTYYGLEIAGAASNGAVTISGSNTFQNKLKGNPDSSIKFTDSTTQTLSSASVWQMTGTAGHLITLTDTTSAAWTLACSSGTISCDFVSLAHGTASGTSTPFYAGANSTNGGSNTLWNFTAPPVNASVNLTGQSMTIAQGTFTYSVDALLTFAGQSITSQLGTLSLANNSNFTLAGQSITSQQGTLSASVNMTLSLTGQAITISQGTLTKQVDSSFSLAGQFSTATLGTLSPSASTALSLSGFSIATQQGNLTKTASSSFNLSGQAITGQQGVLSKQADSNFNLLGQSITSQQGNLTFSASATLNLLTQLINSFIGTLSVSTGATISIDLVGQSLTASLGALTVSADADFSLIGHVLNSSQGTLTKSASSNLALIGQTLNSQIGILSFSADAQVALQGLIATAFQGVLSSNADATLDLSGQSIQSVQGLFTISADSSIFLSGIEISLQQGILRISYSKLPDIVVQGIINELILNGFINDLIKVKGNVKQKIKLT